MLKQLGKYELIRTLGQGAMGEVYLAHHGVIGRDVAIKTILPSAATGAEAEERFRREATAAGRLNHPNLVTIYDFDKEGDLLYLVMEYVKGDDLEDLITQQALTPSQFLEVLAQVCDGLSHAHGAGILHRDIKPSNIRVVREGRQLLAKVMDFGIARTQDSQMTSTGIVMGTVSYMAPEYIQTGRCAAQGDLWAVGVMLYECLTGRKPFGGDNTTTILFKIVSEAPAPIEPGAIQGISPSVRDILDRALSKDPAARFQTAEAFAKALRACRNPSWSGMLEGTVADSSGLNRTAMMPPDPGAPTALGRPIPPLPPTEVLPQRSPVSRKGFPPLALAGLGLLVAAGVGGYLLLKRSPTSAPDPQLAVPSQPVAPPVAPPSTTAPASAPIKAPTPAPHAAQPSTPPTAAVPEPPATISESPEEKLAKAVELIAADPAQAVSQLRDLAKAQPGDPGIQGNLLAALYRARDPIAFGQSLEAAKAAGLAGPQMMKAAPAFRKAMADESRAHRAKDGSQVLPLELVAKVVQ